MGDISVLVATHKNVPKPEFGECYKLIQVGSALNARFESILHDDEGNSISLKNPTYCELTALYWGWKNLHSKYKGLCHYRRYLAKHYFDCNEKTNVYSDKELLDIFEQYNILLPCKKYKNAHNGVFINQQSMESDRAFKNIKNAIEKLCPEYTPSLYKVFRAKTMFFCNVLIAEEHVYDSYCSWLFPLLSTIENALYEQGGVQSREIGYYSEWMLNIWVDHNAELLQIKYTPLARIDRDVTVRQALLAAVERMHILGVLDSIGYYIHIIASFAR